jgi:predicted AlkP superfamily phosphohydrolase/phosphomutase
MLALIGLDSVSPALIDELLVDGRMPSLAALRERGQAVRLETPGTHLVAASFPSLWTGSDVQEHGVYYPFLWAPEQQRVVPSRERRMPPAIWETIAEHGGSVLVIDPYEGRPPAHPVRTCLSGVGFRNRVVLERWDSPPGSLRLWEKRLGKSPAADEVFGQQSVRTLGRLLEPLLGASARSADVVEAVLAGERPDLMVTMLPAPHIAGHQFWDPAAVLPAGASVPPGLETAIRDIYAAADRALGRMVAALPPDADLIVFSVLGMTTNASRNDLLPEMLAAVLGAGQEREGDSGSAWRMRARVPLRLRAAVADALPDRLAIELAARAELRGVDWSTTRAFCVPSDTHGNVRVNLRDRERDGIVPEADADALLDEIAEGLLGFEEPDGAPVVTAVERTADVVPPGPSSHLLPDLIVRWRSSPAHATDVVRSPRFGVVRRAGPGSGRSGNHTDEAWALVVPAHSRLRTPQRAYRVTDLSATALTAAGLATGGEPLLE